jgi:hypothetical protein
MRTTSQLSPSALPICPGHVTAGATARSSALLPNVTLLVNNFNETQQFEAPYQPPHDATDFAVFTPVACTGTPAGNDRVLGVVDNRYSNGAACGG